MAKKLIAIPEGNLMRIAASKGATTLSALKEKTGVDRKTLRLANAGNAIKETTLQSIADKLRVPVAHLVGSSAAVESDKLPRIDSDKYRELKLQRLDAAALRKLAGEHNEINWILKFDQISEELEALLLKLRESLNGWFFHLLYLDAEAGDNLIDQIVHIKGSVDIDKCVEQLEQRDLKILGGTYVTWDRSYRRILVTGGSGGSGLSLRSDDLDSVVELYTADDLRQLVVAAQTMPTLLRGLRELEDHSECGLVREATP